MIKKTIPLLFIALFTFGVLPAQSPDMMKLLNEREQLYKDYAHYSTQKSSFWGTQSKKDQLRIIEVLKKIVLKDSEIVQAIRMQGSQKESNYIGQNHETTDRLYALNEEVQSLTIQLKREHQRLAETEEMLEEAKNDNTTFKRLSIALAVVIAALLFYLIKKR